MLATIADVTFIVDYRWRVNYVEVPMDECVLKFRETQVSVLKELGR